MAIPRFLIAMGDDCHQAGIEFHPRRSSGKMWMGEAVRRVAFGLVIACLAGLMIMAGWIIHNIRTFRAQVNTLRSTWQWDEANGVAHRDIQPLEMRLASLQQDGISVVRTEWFWPWTSTADRLRQLQSDTKQIWARANVLARQQADTALMRLKATEGRYGKPYWHYWRIELQNANSPFADRRLASIWQQQATHWQAEERTLEHDAGGLISGQPANIVQSRTKLIGLMAHLSSNDPLYQQAKNVLSHTDQFLASLSISNQIAQLPMIQQELTSVEKQLTRQEQPTNGTLLSAIASYCATRQSNVSVAVYDARNHETLLYHPTSQFDTASIVKATIMADLLHVSMMTQHPLTGSEQSLMVPMIEQSNNNAASALWQLAGRSHGIGQFLQQVGMLHTFPGRSGYWGLTSTTAEDQIRLMKLFAYSNPWLTNADRMYGLSLMEHVVSWERWGVSDGVSNQATVALKNGWLPMGASNWEINSIGSVQGAGRDYVIAVLTDDNPTEAYGISTVEGVSQLVWKALA